MAQSTFACRVQIVSGVFQNIDPPPPLHPLSVSSLRTRGGGLHTRWAVRGWGVNILEEPDIGLVSYSLIPLRCMGFNRGGGMLGYIVYNCERVAVHTTEPVFLNVYGANRNRFQGMNSASLCSLAGRYDNPIPTRSLALIDCLKTPAQCS